MEVFRLNGCTALFKNRQNQLSFDPLHTDNVDLKTKILEVFESGKGIVCIRKRAGTNASFSVVIDYENRLTSPFIMLGGSFELYSAVPVYYSHKFLKKEKGLVKWVDEKRIFYAVELI